MLNLNKDYLKKNTQLQGFVKVWSKTAETSLCDLNDLYEFRCSEKAGSILAVAVCVSTYSILQPSLLSRFKTRVQVQLEQWCDF